MTCAWAVPTALSFAKTNHLLVAAAASFEPEGVNRLQIGAEDQIYSFLAMRVGYCCLGRQWRSKASMA